MEDGEEDEEGVDDERHDVGERSEGESHPEFSELCLKPRKRWMLESTPGQGRRPRLGLAAAPPVGKGGTRAPFACHNRWSKSETNLLTVVSNKLPLFRGSDMYKI